MSMLSALKNDADVAPETDVLGGGYSPIQTGIYAARVLLAFITKSSGGSMALNLTLELLDKTKIRQVIYMTSGDAKGNRTFFIDKSDGTKKPMPGFSLGNSLALLTLGKDIAELETEKKIVKLYDYEAKKELPKEVDMIMDLLGQEIWVAIFHQTVDKSAKGTDGEYYPTGETRDENEIAKFFRAADKLTMAEIAASADSPKFFMDWEENWKNKSRNRSKGAGQAGAAGTPTLAASNQAPQAPQAGGVAQSAPQGTPPTPKKTDSLFT